LVPQDACWSSAGTGAPLVVVAWVAASTRCCVYIFFALLIASRTIGLSCRRCGDHMVSVGGLSALMSPLSFLRSSLLGLFRLQECSVALVVRAGHWVPSAPYARKPSVSEASSGLVSRPASPGTLQLRGSNMGDGVRFFLPLSFVFGAGDASSGKDGRHDGRRASPLVMPPTCCTWCTIRSSASSAKRAFSRWSLRFFPAQRWPWLATPICVHQRSGRIASMV